ncbi:Mrp/NBP35 family ATP-binding protein [uncultured Rikenella sp.]|uniref:Mrp/NBP35 family ATP-binding protein n=1 Tax=uncultured Rikenella sp. TaxID=368003 RepID=UPI0026262DFF|nr:Mrp/NBP35 family ATP-binding protein [uncultured Rikenella sp.]
MTKEEVLDLLKGVKHPEQDKDIVSLGMVDNLAIDPATGAVRFTLRLTKPRDPMAGSVRRAAEAVLQEATGVGATIVVAEPLPPDSKAAKQQTLKSNTATLSIGRVIAVASGKGGVGKSTVTANLAVALAAEGFRVGVLDADIYGPSMPKMFGVEDYKPVAEVAEDGSDLEYIVPAEAYGVKVMSIGFFISNGDALVWRGPMATNALRQLLHQTAWGELDYLLIDLPPGTGDLHLTIVSELKLSGAVIVSTPQEVALLDVVRGIAMFRNEHVNVPIRGIVENMAWFTPAELPDNKYYIFGPAGVENGGVARLARERGVPFLGSIPLVQAIAEGGDAGEPIAARDSVTGKAFRNLAQALVRNE